MFLISGTVWADDFTVERAVNLGQLDSWTLVGSVRCV